MTISTEPEPLSYNGDDSTDDFSITWKYFAKSHVVATLRASDGSEKLWVLDTDYTLTAAGVEAGGTLSATTPPATGETLVISLDPPNTQGSSLPLGGAFPSTAVEAALDQSAQRDGKLESLFKRSLRVPKTDTQTDSELELPIDTERASKFLAFDGNGSPIAAAGTSADLTPVSSFVNTLLDDADADAFVETLVDDLTALSLPTESDALIVHDASASAGKKITLESLALPIACDLRLTLTSGTPVTTSDVTAATTLYATPYKGNRLWLFDGTQWNLFSFTEMSISVPATTNQMYDVFCYDNSGTLTLELTAWTNDTTRATALTTQDGVLVKTGATTRRYVGSIRTTGVSGQTEDSFAKRYVWNYYNRVPRALRALESNDTWNYTTATWRQARASTANQLDVVVGVAEVDIDVTVLVAAANTMIGVDLIVGIGEDATTPAAECLHGRVHSSVADQYHLLTAFLRKYPAVGRHYYTWIEYSEATGTTTWTGDNANASLHQSGIQGSIDG